MNETLTLADLRAALAAFPATAPVSLLFPPSVTVRAFQLVVTEQAAALVAVPDNHCWDATVADVLAEIANEEFGLPCPPYALPVYLQALDGGVFGVKVEDVAVLSASPLQF
ncbi:hypothetical protein [Deinococcus radiotolerans]|uniref:Uncharacterized protein n=1 Tax=Deinococcus radiotolerans TaxID=1309407 RepID=A0ABQ2FQG8_9DEIO|nr:hypothetical protein [Deinococcus radiotolerans]GGL16775.1 hypothetical protein GCM10010844_39620 [Deinococcus radiotolerans]